MSKKIAIVLELTQSEAETLRALVMRGISWSSSGKFGDDAEAINNALEDVGIVRPNAYPHEPYGGERIAGLAKWRAAP
jgi:uncharacterized phage protein gp47/JayE